MKKIVLILGLLFVPFFAYAQNSSQVEYIPNIDVAIQVNSDSSINIKEIIRYDFGANQRHGIFRIIPVKYTRGVNSYNLKISELKVSDEKGQNVPFSTSYPGNNLEVKIGDKDKLVTGIHEYIVSYKVKKALNYFSDHDELYWNIVGTDWNVPIGIPASTVILPSGVKDSDIQSACYVGVFGSRNQCENISTVGNILNFMGTQNLPAHNGMTIVIGWPKGFVHEPTKSEKFREFLNDNWGFAIPIAAFIVLLFIWQRRGKDPKGSGTIVAEYEAPDGLTPIEVGTLYDTWVNPRDISAEIIFLAINGYLKITQLENKIFGFGSTDYQFDLLKPVDDKLNVFDAKLLNDLFKKGNTIKISELKNKFQAQTRSLSKEVYKGLVDKGYYYSQPNHVRTLYTIIGFFIISLSIFASPFFQQLGLPNSFSTTLAIAITGLLVIGFSFIMVRRTQKGSLAYEKIKGLKLYLSVAEAERIKFHNAPEKTPKVFEKFLPYAMALKVEKQWAKQFEDIYTSPPTWYVGPWPGHFSSAVFVSSLNSFNTKTNMAFAAAGASGLGGGGGVGGGGGGGGGGSW